MKIIIKKGTRKKMEQQGVFNWPVWECAPSIFDWHYDREESCLILEGEITVRTAHEKITISPGDFVTFPKGLDCTWTVTEPVRKHYIFR